MLYTAYSFVMPKFKPNALISSRLVVPDASAHPGLLALACALQPALPALHWVASWIRVSARPIPNGNASAQPNLSPYFRSFPRPARRTRSLRLISRPDIWVPRREFIFPRLRHTPVTVDGVFVGLYR